MSNPGQLPELESLRLQVADLAQELAARDHAQFAHQESIDGELERLRTQSDLLRAIMEDTAADTGDDFFASLAIHLTNTLGMHYAIIGEVLETTPASIRTLAVSSGETLLENFEYDLAAAPCGTGLTESFWCFEQGVQTLFPNFPPLAAMGVESHSGVSIRNRQGKVVGLIVVMDTKPIANQDRLQTLLKVFAPRAAAELHRKQAEYEHRQTLHELQNIMETVPDFMFTLDTQGNLVKWNRRVEEVTGYRPEELHSKSALALVPAHEQEQTAVAIQQAFTDGYAELEGHLLTKDQRTIPYHWTGAALKDPQGRIIGITGIGRDASAQKKAAEVLQRQQHHLLEAQALAHLGSWEWNIESGETDWSEEQFRIFGHAPGAIAVTYDTFLAALLPDDHDRVLAAVNDALLGKCPFNVECRIVRPNGDIRVLHMRAEVQRDATTHPIGMAGTALDITERTQTEEALRASEERWHLAVQGSNDGIWDWNIQAGEIFFSARWKAMRGFSDREVRNHIDEWRSRIHPDDLDRVLQSIDHYLAKQTSAFCEEYRVQRKDGSYMWILDRGVALWADDGTPVRMAGSETDITDRKLAEELLHKSVTRFDLAVQGSQDGLWYAERVSDDLFAPHNPIYYSPRMKEIMGVGNDAMPDVLGTWLSLVHPEDLSRVVSALSQHLEQRVPYNVEYRILQHGTGTLRWIGAKGQAVWDSSGLPIQMAGSFSDITERKQAEETLRQSEERFRRTFEDAGIGMALTDMGGQILSVNSSFCGLLGYTPEELIQKTFMEITHPEDLDNNLTLFTQAQRGELRTYQIGKRYRHKQGHSVWGAMTVSIVYAQSGEPDYVIAMVQDMTARKQAEYKLSLTQYTIDHAIDAFYWINPAAKILDVNEAASHMLGYTKEELLAMTVQDLNPDFQSDMWADFWADTRARRTILFETAHRTKDGRMIPVEIQVNHLTFAGQEFHCAFVRDITDRKQAEEALRESEARYRALVELSPSGVFVFCEGQTVYVNSRAAALLGATEPEEILRRSPFDFIHPDYHADVKANLHRVLAGETTVHRAERIYLKLDQTPLQVEVEAVKMTWKGKPAIQGIFTDITARKQSERKLRLTQFTIDHAVDALYWIDPQGKIVDVNEAATLMLGYSKAEFRTLTIHDLTPDFDAAEWRQYWANDPERRSRGFEIFHLAKDGRKIPVEMEINFLSYEGQEVHCAFVRNISERKAAQEALRRSKMRLAYILENNPAVVYARQVGNEWPFTFITPNVYELLGYTSVDILCTPHLFDDLIHPDDDRTLMTTDLPQLLSEGAHTYVYRLRHRDATYRWIEHRVRLTDDGSGSLQLIGTMLDVTDRKQTEDARLASERQLRTVLNALPVGVWFTNRTGNPLLTNPAAKAIWSNLKQIGWHTSDNPSGWWETLNPMDGPHRWALSRVLTTGEPSLNETLELEGVDGKRKIIRNTTVPVYDEAGAVSGAVILNEDLTDLRRAQEALKLTEFSVAHAVEGFFWVNPQGKILNVNESACRMLEYTHEELTAMSIHDIDPNLLPEEWPTQWDNLKQRGSLTFESRHWSKTGRVLDTEVTVNYLQYNGQEYNCAIMRDISERKRSEAALRQSEELFAKAFRSSPDPMELLELETGTCLDINDACIEDFGYRRDEVLGRTDEEVGHWLRPEDRAQFVERLKREGSIRNLEASFRTRSGDIRQCLVSAELIEFHGKPCMITAGKDITELKRTEESLRESEALFAKAFRSSPYPIVISELESGLCLDANEASIMLFGYRREEIAGRTADDLNIWPSAADRAHFIHRLKEVGSIRNLEVRLRNKAGDLRQCLISAEQIELHGKPCMVTVGTDITERKRAEDDLRRSHAFLRQVIDIDPNFIFAKDRHGRFTLVNKAIAEAYGTRAEALIGKTDADFNSNAQEVEFFQKKDREVLDSLEERVIPEEQLTDTAGRVRWLQTVKRPILDEHGAATMVLGASTDITERKGIEEALRQRERDLRTALEERERISQDLHDGILQSLYAIGLGLESCKPLMRQHKYAKATGLLEQAVSQMNHVMSEVRNFIAGLDSDVLKSGKFPAAVRAMVQTLVANQPIRCRLVIDEASVRCLSTEQALHAMNIIREALSNSLRHGHATFATISLKPLAHSIRLAIRDNGQGFDPAAVKGLGHGLSNMEARASKMGGRFSIHSTRERGTRVTIDLPKENCHDHVENQSRSALARR